jgi:hypothetical protein
MPPMLDLIAAGEWAEAPSSSVKLTADACYLRAEEGDDDDDGDDIVMGGVTQDYKCPLSLRLMTDPLSSCVASRIRASSLTDPFTIPAPPARTPTSAA